MNRISKRFLSLILAAATAFSICSGALAADNQQETRQYAEDHVSFHGISQMEAGECRQYAVNTADGEEAVVGIEKLPRHTRAGGETWRVWYKALGTDVEFYMTVSNNRVTSVYDYSISLVAASYEDAALTKTSTYGKLTFTYKSIGGLAASTCWLKGTVTGENDEIDVTWQM